MTDSRDRYRMDPDDNTYRWSDILDPALGLPFRLAAVVLVTQWEGWDELTETTRAACLLGGALAINALIDHQEHGPPDTVHPGALMPAWFDGWATGCGAEPWERLEGGARRVLREAATLVWDALTPWTGRSPIWAPLIGRVEEGRLRAQLEIDVDLIDWDNVWTDEVEA